MSQPPPPFDLSALVDPVLEAGFPAMYFEPSEEQPFYMVRVVLDSDKEQPEYYLEIMAVPGLQDLHILQFLVAIPVPIVPEHAPTLARYLLDLNAECLLSGFGMRADMRLLYFRSMIPQSTESIDIALLIEVVWAMAYTVTRFTPLIGPVAAGEQSLEEAVEALRAHVSEVYLGGDSPEE
jgi:hypothetical protein